jgi:hypothetical protein
MGHWDGACSFCSCIVLPFLRTPSFPHTSLLRSQFHTITLCWRHIGRERSASHGPDTMAGHLHSQHASTTFVTSGTTLASTTGTMPVHYHHYHHHLRNCLQPIGTLQGENLLGKALMRVRATLGGATNPATSPAWALSGGQILGSGAEAKLTVVKASTPKRKANEIKLTGVADEGEEEKSAPPGPRRRGLRNR